MKRFGSVLLILCLLLVCTFPAAAAYDWNGESFLDDYYGIDSVSSDEPSLYAASDGTSVDVAGTAAFQFFSGVAGSLVTKHVYSEFPSSKINQPLQGDRFQYGSGLAFSQVQLSSSMVSNYDALSSVYFSFFFQIPDGNSLVYWHGTNAMSPTDFNDHMKRFTYYLYDSSRIRYSNTISTEVFTPVKVVGSASNGYQVSIDVPSSFIYPGGRLLFGPTNAETRAGAFVVGPGATSSVGSEVNFCVVSFNTVGFASEEEKADLEAIVNKLAENNELLRAMYGEVVQLVKDLSETVDRIDYNLLVVDNRLTVVTSKLASLDATASNIYSLLNTYLRYLQTIARTADDIESAIDSFHSDFISKIDRIISTTDDIDAELKAFNTATQEKLDRILAALEGEVPGTSDLEDKNNAAQDSMNAYDDIEKQWATNMSNNFDSLHMGDFTFDAGLLSGFALLTGIFNDIWNAMGIYNVLFVVPLMLGIGLLVIGRASRYISSSGGGGSGGGSGDDGLRHRGGVSQYKTWQGKRG